MSDEICVGDGFSTYEERDKIVVGLSGGVDSSVCIKILAEQGFEVIAVFVRFSPAHDKSLQAARDVAQQLNVPLQIYDCTEQFDEFVIKPFCEEYCKGITPSPCVMCNPLVKFNALAKVADSVGAKLIASGHYARVTEENGVYYIEKGISESRDQSYMLYRLPQEILSRLCLPVGEFEKGDIREMAQESKLVSADAPDSQEICFIPDNNYANYIINRGYNCPKGRFIGPKGEDFGEHKGVLYYTVGQRKGLNISYSEPLFVKRILQDGNIELATAGSEFFSEVDINNIVSTNSESFCVGDELFAKIRSRANPSPCIVKSTDNNVITLEFKEPQRAPAPGQSLVFYKGTLVVGGGVICGMR